MGTKSFLVSAFYVISFVLIAIVTTFMGFDVKSVIAHYQGTDSCEVHVVISLYFFSVMLLLAITYFFACLTWFRRSYKMAHYAGIMAGILLMHFAIHFATEYAKYAVTKEYEDRLVYKPCYYKPSSMNALLGACWFISYHGCTYGLINFLILKSAAKKEEKERNGTLDVA